MKPHYLFRPRQGLVRLLQTVRRDPGEVTVRLPWGMPLAIDTSEAIGLAIWRLGVYDLVLSETIWRLLTPGDLAIDAGANLGYTTGLMAWRCGPRGRVVAFEPHAGVSQRLRRNVDRWRDDPRLAPVEARPEALSSAPGRLELLEGRGFDRNRGTAHAATTALIEAEPGTATTVPATTLDAVLDGRSAALVKVDVEGHEGEVLAGAEHALATGRIRHLLYEAYARDRAALAERLWGHGYVVWALGSTFFGPRLASDFEKVALAAYEAPNFLATRDPLAARRALGRRGWSVLR